jgi:hypothetical protein
VSVGLVVTVIAVILAIAAVEVAVLVVWSRRRKRRLALEGPPPDEPSVVPAKPRGKPLPILTLVFTSIGVVLAVGVGGISGAVIASSRSGDQHADGTVVKLHYNGKNYQPVVEFTPPGGTPTRFKSMVGSSPPAFHDGEHVGVRYHPGNPNDAVIDDYWQIWFLPTLFGIIGGGFLLIGTILGVVTLVARLRRS